MVEARLRSVSGAMGRTGPPGKGEAAEGLSICLGAVTWAVGGTPPGLPHLWSVIIDFIGRPGRLYSAMDVPQNDAGTSMVFLFSA